MEYLTEKERKEKISHRGNYYSFESCVDLSTGVAISANSANMTDFKPVALVSDTMQFTAWWMLTYHKRLNGFAGLDTIKFVFKIH